VTAVLTALGNAWESRIATLLGRSREVRIVQRCADLADLLATAAAGLGSVALVSADLRGLDLSAVARLREAGVDVVGVSTSADHEEDEAAERRLRQLGIVRVLRGDADLATFEAVLGQHDGRGQRWPADGTRAPGPTAGDLDDTSADAIAGDRNPDADRALDAELDAVLAQQGGARLAPSAGQDTPRREDAGAPTAVAAEPGRIVAVWGPTGAPGRTTVAVTLASELAVLGVPTVLVDADTYGGSVAQALSFLDEAPGIAAATRAADQGTLDLVMLARLSPLAGPGLRVLTGIPKADRWTEVRAPALERVLTLARRLGQVVVVDCGFNLEDDEELSYDTMAPRRNAATLTTLSLADELVAVGGCDPVSLQRLVRGLQELETVPSPRPVVVVNRVRAGAVGPRPEAVVSAALSRFAGVDDLLFVPDDPAALDAALLEGRSLAECAPQSPVRAAVRALATRVARVSLPPGRRGRRLLHR
jgi:Flp pilus assembly CpaE family ATPase